MASINAMKNSSQHESIEDPAIMLQSEALRELIALLGRKTLPIPAELLANHLIEVTKGMDWPVKRAAGEALLKRLAFGKRDVILICSGYSN